MADFEQHYPRNYSELVDIVSEYESLNPSLNLALS
jgi:hypothetical protein